jgi:hypothetical protein
VGNQSAECGKWDILRTLLAPAHLRRPRRFVLRLLLRELPLYLRVKPLGFVRHLQGFFVNLVGRFFVQGSLKALLGFVEKLPGAERFLEQKTWRGKRKGSVGTVTCVSNYSGQSANTRAYSGRTVHLCYV